MNIDQESYLSAYLDGELDSEPQSRVESALVADHGLSGRLRELSTVRDLVSGLSRPLSPIDVSVAVLARIEHRRTSAISHWVHVVSGTRSGRVATLVVAASVLMACALIGLDKIGPKQSERETMATHPESLVNIPLIPTNSSEQPIASPLNVVDGKIVLEPASVGDSHDPAHIQSDAAAARKLLESPQLDRVFMLTDVLGGNVERHVGEILKTTARHSSRTTFGRIEVRQGITIDPEHAGQAVVFAIVMNDVELNEFYERLTTKYSGSIKVSTLRPELVTRLSEIGAIALIAGRPGSGLRAQPSLREEEASRALKGGNKPVEKVLIRDSDSTPSGSDPLQDRDFRNKKPEADLVVVARDTPTPGQLLSAPHPSVRSPRDGSEAISTDLESTSTSLPKPFQNSEVVKPVRHKESLILVWITTSGQPSVTPK